MEKYQLAEHVNGGDPEGERAYREVPHAFDEDQAELPKNTHEPISEEELEESQLPPTPPRGKKTKGKIKQSENPLKKKQKEEDDYESEKDKFHDEKKKEKKHKKSKKSSSSSSSSSSSKKSDKRNSSAKSKPFGKISSKPNFTGSSKQSQNSSHRDSSGEQKAEPSFTERMMMKQSPQKDDHHSQPPSHKDSIKSPLGHHDSFKHSEPSEIHHRPTLNELRQSNH